MRRRRSARSWRRCAAARRTAGRRPAVARSGRLVRSALRQCVVARQAPGIMIAGLGREKDGEGARDVFDYVARDAKTAIKSQKISEGSADFRESVGRLGVMIGAAAQAAAALSDPGKRTYEGSLRAGVKAFVAEAIANDGLTAGDRGVRDRRHRHGDGGVMGRNES